MEPKRLQEWFEPASPALMRLDLHSWERGLKNERITLEPWRKLIAEKSMRPIFAFVILLLASAIPAFAETVKLAAVDAAPLSSQDASGKLSGVSVEIVRELAGRAGIPLTEIAIPISRMEELAHGDAAIFPTVSRNATREAKFHWIGKVIDDPRCFVTVKGMPQVTTIEGARKLKAVGINQGWNTETLLRKEGLNNLVPAPGDAGNARKLKAKIIDAWYTSKALARAAMKQEGVDPSQVECSGDFGVSSFWIAASKKLPADQLEKLKSAYGELEKNGFIQARRSTLD